MVAAFSVLVRSSASSRSSHDAQVLGGVSADAHAADPAATTVNHHSAMRSHAAGSGRGFNYDGCRSTAPPKTLFQR
jgi:hypothetical protein